MNVYVSMGMQDGLDIEYFECFNVYVCELARWKKQRGPSKTYAMKDVNPMDSLF